MPAAPHMSSTQVTTVLRVLTGATFIVILNETILVTAMPTLMASLGVEARTAQWLSTGFMLTMAVVIPTTGWFIQRVGRRGAFVAAMSSFAVGTAVAALAPSFEVLLVARVVQALGTAVMMPLLMSSVMALAPESERGRVMGNVSLAISVAPALGPTVSGLVLAVAPWRWIFVVVLPLAIAALVAGSQLLHPSRLGDTGDVHGELGRPDVASMVLTAVGFGGLVYGLSEIGGAGSSLLGLPTWSAVIGLVGVLLFAWRQVRLVRSGSTPLLDLRVLRIRPYLWAILLMSLSFMALMGTMMMLPMLFQQVKGLSTLQSGLMLMPGGILMGLLGPRVGRLYDRVGAAPLVLPGAVAVAVVLAAMAWAAGHGPVWWFLALHVVMSVALACVFTPVFTTGLGALPGDLYEHGSALLGTVQQVAAAAGTALVFMIMSTRLTALHAQGADAQAALTGGIGASMAVSAALAALAVGVAVVFASSRPRN